MSSRNPHLDDEDIASLPDFLRHLLADERQAAGPAYNRHAVRAQVEPPPPAAPLSARPVAQVRTVPPAPSVPPRRSVRMPDADPRKASQGRLL